MKENLLKDCQNVAETNLLKTDRLNKENSKKDFLSRRGKPEGYVKVCRKSAVEKFETLQSLKCSDKQGKRVFCISCFVFLSRVSENLIKFIRT